MDLFRVPPEGLSLSDVLSFLEESYPEGPRLDYKREMNLGVIESVAAMANTSGGIIIVGVDEDKSTKTPILPPVGIGMRHFASGTLVNYCHTRLEPKFVPPHKFLALDNDPTRAILVIRVAPESIPLPVWVEEKGVLIRAGDSDRPADLRTLRILFALGDQRATPLDEAAAHEIGIALQANVLDLTFTVVGAKIHRTEPGDYWTSGEQEHLLRAVGRIIGTAETDVRRAAGRLSVEKSDPFVRVSLSAEGIVVVQFGWNANPFPIAAAIWGLTAGVGLLLTEEFRSVYQPIYPIEVTLGLVNWPMNGLTSESVYDLPAPRPISYAFHRMRVHRTYLMYFETQPWSLIRPFVERILADGGFTGFERFLDEPPRIDFLRRSISSAGLVMP